MKVTQQQQFAKCKSNEFRTTMSGMPVHAKGTLHWSIPKRRCRLRTRTCSKAEMRSEGARKFARTAPPFPHGMATTQTLGCFAAYCLTRTSLAFHRHGDRSDLAQISLACPLQSKWETGRRSGVINSTPGRGHFRCRPCLDQPNDRI
jgi:hypothetical protein